MTTEEQAYEQALRYLSLRSHSRKELVEKLARKGYMATDIECVLSRLERVSLVDDERLAKEVYKRFIEEGIYGNSYISYRMHAKGLVMPERMPQEIEVERALQLVQKKLLRSETTIKRSKLTSFLANRGYGASIMKAVCEALGERVLLDIKRKKFYNDGRQS